MLIPGWFISIITFPGVIVHEIAHQFFCKVFRIAVLDVCYFRFGNPAGYVIHEAPRIVYQHLLIGIGPFIINSLLGALIAAPSAIPVLRFEVGTPLDYLLIWLGVSIAMHSFPSAGDAKGMWEALWAKGTPALARLAGTPLVLLIYIGALGSMFWLDLVYGMVVAMFVPNVLVAMLA